MTGFLIRVLTCVMTDFSESTKIQKEAANRPTSFRRNCPGATVIAGTPSSGTTTPGVETMKLTVVTKQPGREKTAGHGEERARQPQGDQKADAQFDEAEERGEAAHREHGIEPAQQRAVLHQRHQPLRLVVGELHAAEPGVDDRERQVEADATDRFGVDEQAFGVVAPAGW